MDAKEITKKGYELFNSGDISSAIVVSFKQKSIMIIVNK